MPWTIGTWFHEFFLYPLDYLSKYPKDKRKKNQKKNLVLYNIVSFYEFLKTIIISWNQVPMPWTQVSASFSLILCSALILNYSKGMVLQLCPVVSLGTGMLVPGFSKDLPFIAEARTYYCFLPLSSLKKDMMLSNSMHVIFSWAQIGRSAIFGREIGVPDREVFSLPKIFKFNVKNCLFASP